MTMFACASTVGSNVAAVVERCAADIGKADKDSLGFVYVSDPLSARFDEIIAGLSARTEITRWVGTVGLGICGRDREYFGEPAVSVLTCGLDGGAYRILPMLTGEGDLGGAIDRGFAAGVGIVHGDPRQQATLDIVERLAGDNGLFLIGGLTSAEHHFIQVADTIGEGGVSGVLLGSDAQVAVGLSQGCSPIGPAHVVTQGQDNVLVTLDERSAYETLCEDLGVADGVDPRPWLSNVHVAMIVSGGDTHDYLVRNLVALDQERGLVAIGDGVAVGGRIQFVRRDAQNAAKDLERMLAELKGRADAPKAGLYYSCLARGPNLFDEPDFEVNAIRKVFGDIPLAGFFGNGEISNNRIYGYTGVLLLFL